MGVNLAADVSDLCIAKQPLTSLPPCATVADALRLLRMAQETFLTVCTGGAAASHSCQVLGKVCITDILCYLCSDQNISSPAAALDHPVSALLPKSAATVRRIESNSSIIEALDVILAGAQSLVVPKRKLHGGGDARFCLLTMEDFVRFFLNSIALFSAVTELSVGELGLVRPAAHVVRSDEPALSAVPLLLAALADQTSVAVVSDNGRLLGEISPSTLARSDIDSTAAALAALSAADLVDYVDCSGCPPESKVRSIKSQLKEKDFDGMLEFLETGQLQFSSSPTSSCSSSSDEDQPMDSYQSGGAIRYLGFISNVPDSEPQLYQKMAKLSHYSLNKKDEEPVEPLSPPLRCVSSGRCPGSYAARMGRRSEEAIVCHASSSLVAVMVQALAHRVSYVWVVDGEDHLLAGIVKFSGILQVFRDQIQAD